MSLVGLGMDVVDLDRIERLWTRHGDAFVGRICRPGEFQERTGSARIEHLGGLWAAKEAVLKALGTGWADGLAFRQVEVVRDARGAPSFRLHDQAAERARVLGSDRGHLTITHERRWAAAVAILERDPAAAAEPS